MEKKLETVEVEEKVEAMEATPEPTKRSRFVDWVKDHKVGLAVGAGAAILTGVGAAARKALSDRMGIDLVDDIVDVVGSGEPEA